MRKNVHAYTEPGADRPAYLSINRDGDQFEVSVRSRFAEGAGQILLTREQVADLVHSLHAAVMEK